MQRIVKIDNKEYRILHIRSEVFQLELTSGEINKLRVRFGDYFCVLHEFFVRGKGVEVSAYGEAEPPLKIEYRSGEKNTLLTSTNVSLNKIVSVIAKEPGTVIPLRNSRVINMAEEPLIIEGKGLNSGVNTAFVQMTFTLLRPVESSA